MQLCSGCRRIALWYVAGYIYKTYYVRSVVAWTSMHFTPSNPVVYSSDCLWSFNPFPLFLSAVCRSSCGVAPQSCCRWSSARSTDLTMSPCGNLWKRLRQGQVNIDPFTTMLCRPNWSATHLYSHSYQSVKEEHMPKWNHCKAMRSYFTTHPFSFTLMNM